MQRRKDDLDIKDTAEKLVTFSHRTLYLVLWTVILTVFGASAGYFDIRATAREAIIIGKENRQTISPMACDVRQLKNFMIYGVRPAASDRCPKES